jgi:hypothetical protein
VKNVRIVGTAKNAYKDILKLVIKKIAHQMPYNPASNVQKIRN